MSRKPLLSPLFAPLPAAVAAVIGLAACAGPATHAGWTAQQEAGGAAYDECRDEIDTTMRLRGYPTRPSPETPQFDYRKEIFGKCMRRKGYEPD